MPSSRALNALLAHLADPTLSPRLLTISAQHPHERVSATVAAKVYT